MDSHELTAVQLTQFYLHRIRKLDGMLNASSPSSPTPWPRRAPRTTPVVAATIDRCWGSRSSSRTTSTRPACRHRRLLVAGREHARGRVHHRAAESGRRHHHRQGEPVRVGELPVHPVVERLERRRRPDEPGLRPRPQPVRLQLRHGCRRLGDLAVAAVGTETDGSIVCPSGANGIVGIKPTLGSAQR